MCARDNKLAYFVQQSRAAIPVALDSFLGGFFVRNSIRVLLAVVITLPLFAVSKNEATYINGTTTAILKDASGTIQTEDRAALVFHWESDKGFGDWSLPYEKIVTVSYGQQVGRGLGSNIALGVSTLGTVPILSKKRRHFVTLAFVDSEGEHQTATFEVGKDAIRNLLSMLEVRTHKKVIYLDADAEGRKTASK